MNHYYRFLAFLCLVIPVSFLIASCSNTRSGKPKVLVFSKTAGYEHASIPDGIAAIQKLGEENGFEVDTTKNSNMFTEDSLEQYSTVIFLSTTGNVLNKYQEADFERYIQAGGGYVGIHAAADTEYEWGWYGEMVGGYFLDHPGINDPHPNVQPGVLHVEDSTHTSTVFLPAEWERTDEWYSYKGFNEDTNVLLTIDEDSYKGGADMGYHPMAWYHQYDGGRAFYTGLGHTSESFTEDLYLQHILAGIQYAIGENRVLDYSQATTERVPAANRFSKKKLVEGQFFEPVEMTILPNRDVLIAQRRGEIMLYKNSDSILTQAGKLDVYWEAENPDVNAEEGLLGIKADPNFEENNHVFVFYSPADTSVNRLSRFTFEGDKMAMDSEEIILQFYSQRNICCHTGGSIAFDKDGFLYLSTGDNSTPFNQRNSKYINNGFAPLDERDGYRQYNALRSSGNANDLRGKILRIRVNEDGTYEIPEGNLYPENQEGTRPEIFVQGNRNPYRISVDQKTDYLYWGEVGPDANNDSLKTRGPRGYDEINQAREAGFFGWPMFIADNQAYYRFNYATGETGKQFDPGNPVNDSRYNTGIKELPPAKPAFIWYPYAASEEFPSVGTGGRNAMAGPVYYTDMYPEETRLPEYFDGKLFIYEWVRGWIKLVTMKPNGDYSKMESFMEDTDLNALIDMEIGPEGRVYLLEYGSAWFSQNDDSGLSFVKYNPGNRDPVIDNMTVNKTSGVLPLSIEASVEARDPENDELRYIWNLGDGMTKETSEPTVEHTYNEIGEYSISVDVRDIANHTVTSSPISVYAGNAAPEVNIEIKGNSSFYFPGTPVEYEVHVEDKDSEINEDLPSLVVSADYVEGADLAEASRGHQIMTEVRRGENLINSLDCQACHRLDSQSIGPSYMEVAERYQDSSNAESHLVNKIIQGGSGVWGETVMPAHLDISEADARKMVSWIQSLAGDEQATESLPPSGTVDPTQGEQPTPSGVLILSASYTDQGGPNVKPMTGNASIYLRNSTINIADVANLEGYQSMTFDDQPLLMVPEEHGSFSLNQIDLTGVGSVQLVTVAPQPLTSGYIFELRLDSPDGDKIGEVVFEPNPNPSSGEGPNFQPVTINIDAETDGELHDLYMVSRPEDPGDTGTVILSTIKFMSGN